MNKSTLFLAGFIILISSVFRITNLDLIEFKADEAINLFLASRPIFGHSFAPGGTVSSLGVLNFPLLNYILFPLVLVSTDPRVIVFFIGSINSLSIGILFLIFNRYYGQTVALISSALFALSPWAILFSRKIWAQDLIIPLSIPLILSIHKIIFDSSTRITRSESTLSRSQTISHIVEWVDNKEKYWILYIVSSLLLMQIYHSAIFFLLPFSILLFLKRRPKLKYLLIGLIIGLVPTLHYFVYQATNFCPDCETVLAIRERLAPTFHPEIFIRPLQILGRGNIHAIIGQDMVTFLKEFPLIFQIQKIFYLEYLLLPVGFILFWKKFKNFRAVLISIITLPLIYFLFRIEPFIHYFIVILPFLFLFIAFSIAWLLKQKRILLRSISAVSLISLLIASVLFNYGLFELIKRGKGLKGDYGAIYITTEKKHKAMLEKYEGAPHYQEMVMASYIPPSLLHGDIGIAKMLYSKESAEREMLQIEERLKKVPEDPRMHAKLIYYYTRTLPTGETLKLLEQKTKEIPGYLPVYSEVKRFSVENK